MSENKNHKPIPRQDWLDATRGIAIVVSMYVHLMRWILESFSSWGDMQESVGSSWEILLIRGIEGYLRICWIAPFVIGVLMGTKALNWDFSWYFKRFAFLFFIPTLAWMAYDQAVYVRFEIIQALFIFTVLSALFSEMNRGLRYFIYIATVILCIVLFPHREELAHQGLLFKILLGGPDQANFFALLYGLPAFYWYFELYFSSFNRDKNEWDLKIIDRSTIVASLALGALLVSGYNSWIPRHYPPQLMEYFASFAFTGLMHTLFVRFKSKVSSRGLLTVIGRYCWIHFLGHLLVGAIVFEYYGDIFANKLGFMSANLVVFGIIISLWLFNLYLIDRGKKNGK